MSVYRPQNANTDPVSVPSIGTIKDGETVKIECVDWTGGQIGNNDSADDVRNVDLTKIHYLSGPFDIEGAEPGDVLLVEIQDVQPFDHQPWGFTGVFAKDNGGGFLDEIYPEAYVAAVQPHHMLIPLTEQKQSGTFKASSAALATSPVCALLGSSTQES